MDESARQPILTEAESFLAEYLAKVNELTDDLTRYAKALVDKPDQMTPELFIYPNNVAPRKDIEEFYERIVPDATY